MIGLWKKKFHLFRNGINPLDSYYIEYIDAETIKKRKFFPDFIITTKNKIIILEVKGIGKNNIDSKAETKLKSISNDIKLMIKEKEILVFKVGSINTPNNENDLICYQYKNGKKDDKANNLDYLKQIILN